MSKWRARWEARRQEVEASAQGAADCELRGPGVRVLLQAWCIDTFMVGDELTEPVRSSVAALGLEIPDDVRVELHDENAGDATAEWLLAQPQAILEHVATEWVKRQAIVSGASAVRAQVDKEEEAALEAIDELPVPWVTARPAKLGDQRDAFDGADDETDADRDGEVAAKGVCLGCGCTEHLRHRIESAGRERAAERLRSHVVPTEHMALHVDRY